MGLLKFIFATILVLYIIRLLVRLLLPLFLQKAVNKMASQQQQQYQSKQSSSKPEGSISIEYMPPQTKPGNVDKLGDFVEYEEVK